MHILIFGGHACLLLSVSVCIDVNFILAYVTIGSYVLHALASVYKRSTVTEEMPIIEEPEHVAVRLELLEISSITTPN